MARQDFGAGISACRWRQGGIDGRAALGGSFGPGGGEKILKTYIHRSFLNSNYISITSQKLFANKNIKDYHILPHSFHKITSTYHFHYLIHFSKSSVPTISLPHSFSQNHHSQFITTNHVIISFIPLNHNHLSYFTSSVFRNHNSQYVIASSILHPKAKQPNKTKKTDQAKNNTKNKTIDQQ